MNCLDFRRLSNAEPNGGDPAFAAHADSCPACADYLRRIQAFDRRLQEAMQIPVPEENRRARPTPDRRRDNPPGVLPRIAAVVLFAIAAGTLLWLFVPQASLASSVVAHMRHEPHAWDATNPTVPHSEVEAVLRRSGVRLNIQIGQVSYAQSCMIRGHIVPHLVVRDEQGPVTVLVLNKETVERETQLDESGYTGVILPAKHGAIAVLTRDRARVDAIAERVLQALEQT